jgi:hypothetical protein
VNTVIGIVQLLDVLMGELDPSQLAVSSLYVLSVALNVTLYAVIELPLVFVVAGQVITTFIPVLVEVAYPSCTGVAIADIVTIGENGPVPTEFDTLYRNLYEFPDVIPEVFV